MKVKNTIPGTPRHIVTRSDERGRTRISWLDSRHSFSFGEYYDPERMGFGPLRVFNDDRIAASAGFPTHPHRDMEIVSLALEGQLQHRDSMGNGSVIEAGELQYMSAGTGVTHSEFNPSAEQGSHFIQLWIQPDRTGYEPRYDQRAIPGSEAGHWQLLLSPDGREASVAIRQDALLHIAELESGQVLPYTSTEDGRGFWLFVLHGTVVVDGEVLATGDSLAVSGQNVLEVLASADPSAKVLLFDLPIAP